jgi:hypothetical protein
LHTEGIDFAPWGDGVVKALVLAKFMLLGNAMKIGSRNTTLPLIWPTLHKAEAMRKRRHGTGPGAESPRRAYTRWAGLLNASGL